jgi:hypothetical protein
MISADGNKENFFFAGKNFKDLPEAAKIPAHKLSYLPITPINPVRTYYLSIEYQTRVLENTND